MSATGPADPDDSDDEHSGPPSTSGARPASAAAAITLPEPHPAWRAFRAHADRSLKLWKQLLSSSGTAAPGTRRLRHPWHAVHLAAQLWNIAAVQGVDALQQLAAEVIGSLQRCAVDGGCSLAGSLADALAAMPSGSGWANTLLDSRPPAGASSVLSSVSACLI